MRKFVTAVVIAVTSFFAGTALSVVSPVSAGKPVTSPPAPVVLWAVVNVDGTLARGNGVVSTTFADVDGVYWVEFNRDVTQCAYVATAGEATDFPADDAITFGVSPSDRNPNEIYLIEFDAILNQDAYSSGFDVIVTCPPA